MVTLKRHNVKVYVNCLSYFIFVLQNGVLKVVIWYWVPYFTHEFIYFSSLRNNIFSFFCAPVGILKTIPSVHTTVSVCEEIPSSSFMYRPQWPPHLQRETYISWDIIMTSASFFFQKQILHQWRTRCNCDKNGGVYAMLTEIFKERM